jgi:hypothetical protein
VSHPKGLTPEESAEREDRERWAMVFGRVIVAFGQIEWATDHGLRAFPREKIFPAIGRTAPVPRRAEALLEGRFNQAGAAVTWALLVATPCCQ